MCSISLSQDIARFWRCMEWNLGSNQQREVLDLLRSFQGWGDSGLLGSQVKRLRGPWPGLWWTIGELTHAENTVHPQLISISDWMEVILLLYLPNTGKGSHLWFFYKLYVAYNKKYESWLVWLSRLSASLRTKGLPVRFPVRAWEAATHWCFFPSLSPSLPLSKNK